MSTIDDAIATQMTNIAKTTGVSIEEWYARIGERMGAGQKHGQIAAWLREEHGFGHGNAGMLTHLAGRALAPKTETEMIDAQYTGAKAALRPIYERVLAEAVQLGDDVEVSPKKASVSLRRKKQFALISPATSSRIDLGFNFRGHAATERLKEEPPGRMCTHVVRISSLDQLDAEVLGWLAEAYAGA
ncbi:MAG: DUF5655 domain-containing protein [Pseudomonadota bacterium]|nr:DUF5655 domain-containing protein [Pseudomonadota bacterium]